MESRSERRRETQPARPPMGVFRIRNKANGKLLVGSSVNVPAILNRMRGELRMGSHRNQDLQLDWNRYGGESFDFEILEELDVEDREHGEAAGYLALMLELWLKELEPWGERGYNKPPSP